MSKATEAILGQLHAELAGQLKEAIQPEPIIADGQVVGRRFNAAALREARQFLLDNKVSIDVADSKPLRDLVEGLPSFEDNPGLLAQVKHH